MTKIIICAVLIAINISADNSISIGGNNTNNNGVQIFTQKNNYDDSEKEKFDSRISNLSKKLINDKDIENRSTISAVVASANEANSFDISPKQKSKKCIEYGGALKIFKINLSIFRKECENIFK
jgi:hypothetical protein